MSITADNLKSENAQFKSNRRKIANRLSQFFIKNSFTGSTKMLKFLTPMITPIPTEPIIAKTNYGFKLYLNLQEDSVVEKDIFYTGTYEPGILDVMKKTLYPGDIFIDAGANIGLMSIHAAKLVGENGKVLSFEPEPNTLKILNKNIAINNLKNISVYNCGLGSIEESQIIYDAICKNRGMASLMQSSEVKSGGTQIIVRKLDDILAENNLEKVKFLKIDVEGWELEVLKGAKNLLASENAPIICIEYFVTRKIQNGTPDDIVQMLKDNDYRIFKLDKGTYKISKLKDISNIKKIKRDENLICMKKFQIPQLPRRLFVY
ncbi:MAG: FkbM family methyltransferase [Candidatus Gastranaerophilales bacterium]|nr:FkbM family methyltransferase [Candidatus Gastranaerophilales bacterium]